VEPYKEEERAVFFDVLEEEKNVQSMVSVKARYHTSRRDSMG
jgi:hypothetical protein